MARAIGALLIATVLVAVPAIATAEMFIAVYINPDNLEWATAQGSSLEEASRIAAESCGKGCRRAAWSRDACVALALKDDDGTCWGGAWGNSPGEANNKALRYCRDRGCSCKVVFSECYR